MSPGLRTLQCLTVWRPSRGGCVTAHGRPPLRSGPVSLETGILVGVHRQGTGDGCSQYPWDDLATVRGVVARIVTGPHDATRQDPHLPMRCDTGRPRAVIRFRIAQPRTASLPCLAGLRARRLAPMMDVSRKNVFSTRS